MTDLPAWITAGAATIAAVGGIGTLVYTGRTQRRIVDGERREQARHVAVVQDWYNLGWKLEDPQATEKVIKQFSELTFTVRNTSKQPVYGIAVRLLGWDWRQRRDEVAIRWIAAMGPESSTEAIDIGRLPEWRRKPGRRYPITPPLEIEFTDNQGVRWRRDPAGQLTEVEDPWLADE